MHRRNHETLTFVRERLTCGGIVFVGDDPQTDDAVAFVEVGGRYHIIVVRADPRKVRVARLIYPDRRACPLPIPVRPDADADDIKAVSKGRTFPAASRIWFEHVLPCLRDREVYRPAAMRFPLGV